MSPGRHAAPDPDDDYPVPGYSPAGYEKQEYEQMEPLGLGTRAVDFEIEAASSPAAPPSERPVGVVPPAYDLAPGPVIADGVSYARGGRSILDAVSVRVQPGDSLALVGPSGSGKSSLLALLAGLERPDAGAVGGASARTGLILQGYGLVSVLTAAENVEVPLQSGVRGELAAPAVRAAAAAALDSVGLRPVADHLIEELSGGQQQRVAIARALAIDPDVVFADEVTAELDHEWKDHVVGLLLDVARRGGVVVLATHDPEIAARCSTVVRLIDGRLSEGSTPWSA